MSYAHETTVAVERSKTQIECLLIKHGAEGYHTGWQNATPTDPGWDAIEFVWKGKVIRFRLPRPTSKDKHFKDKYGMQLSGNRLVTAMDQRNRSRWRILFLVVKAKLEAVEGGIAVFEEEFMSFIVTANGKTVGEVLLPRLQASVGPLQLGTGE